MPKIAQKKKHNIYYHYLLLWLQAVNMAITIDFGFLLHRHYLIHSYLQFYVQFEDQICEKTRLSTSNIDFVNVATV